MKKVLLTGFISFLLLFNATAQVNSKMPGRLRVFVDCGNTWCDMTFIRSEINLIDFMLDRIAADVHLLVTEQGTGGGGRNYQLIFFGQQDFKKMQDTLHFNTGPNATDFEKRDLLIKYMNLGLAPFVAKTEAAKDAVISFKKKDTGDGKADSAGKTSKDPWNYWVFKVGANGYLEADENYQTSSLSGDMSANRVTEELKVGINISGGKNTSTFETEDSQGNREKTKIGNNSFNFQHYLIKSLGQHWSYGYEVVYSRSTFSNNKNTYLFRTGIEYAIFPYKEVNTKFFTVSYIADVRRNNYFDTTLYEKTKETLFGHGVESNLSFNQKWGTVSFGAEYHNYFHDWSLFNLGVNTALNIRITGGLSFTIYTSAALTRDQLFLPKEGATPLEVLTRRRQLASGYNFYTSFGISYRFGSKLNNFVNPRFD